MKFFSSPIFDGITQEEYTHMMKCFSPVYNAYKQWEVIQEYESREECIGILYGGQAAVVRVDEDGTRSILEGVQDNAAIGKTLNFYQGDNEVSLICTQPCEMMFIDSYHVTKRCERACECHSKLVENIFKLVISRAQNLSMRVDVLTQRTVRRKLLYLFYFLAKERNSYSFEIPFRFNDLADFLAIDRCSMLREMKKMEDEGIIKRDYKHIVMLDKNFP